MGSARRLTILFLVTALVLLGSFVALFLIGVASAREFGDYRTHKNISEHLAESLSLLRDAEAAEVRYVFRGDPAELKSYDQAIGQIHEQLDFLVKRNEVQLDRRQVERLGQLIDGEVALLRGSIELRKSQGFGGAMNESPNRQEAEARESIRSQVAMMLAREQAQLDAALGAGIRSFRARALLFLALFVLNMGVLVWSYRRIVKEARARQAALIDARAAKAELEEAGRAKDQFLASLSHELRTPLTPVLAMISAWQGEGLVPKNLQADVQLMRRNVELEARLIDDLLDLTRIAKGKLPLNREVADVHELIQAAAKVCEAGIREKGISVLLELEAARHHANVDPARVEQVLWNVLKNATKFTPENGSIRITTRNPELDKVAIAIRDSGIGMSKATLVRVFEPFEQGDMDVMRRFGGLGLGMAISKALVECQNGTIAARSDGPGKGSEFTITLATADAPVIATASAPSPSARPSRDNRRLRILLVEDHPDTADVLGRVLRSRGHEVKVCDSVAAAASAVQTGELDLLLSDIGLPDGTGLDLIRQIRLRHKIPAIALTGYGMDDDIARCKDAGFDGHLTKPVSFEKLDAIIGQFTQN